MEDMFGDAPDELKSQFGQLIEQFGPPPESVARDLATIQQRQRPAQQPIGGGLFDAYSQENQGNLKMAMFADIIGNLAGKDVGATKGMLALAENARKLRLQNEQRTAAQNMLGGGVSGAGGSEWMTPQQKAYLTSTAISNPQKAIEMIATWKTQFDSNAAAAKQLAFTNEGQLRASNDKGLKGFYELQNAFGGILASAQEATGPSDIALVTKFMKVLDPGSVVREGEFITARESGSFTTSMKNIIEKAESGEILQPEQRKAFVKAAYNLYEKAMDRYNTKKGVYGTMAKHYGLNPEMVQSPGGIQQSYIDDYNSWYNAPSGNPAVDGDVPEVKQSLKQQGAALFNTPTTSHPTGGSGRNRPRTNTSRKENVDPRAAENEALINNYLKSLSGG